MRTDNNLFPVIAIAKCLKYLITARYMSCVLQHSVKQHWKCMLFQNFLDITSGCEETNPRIYKIVVLARNTWGSMLISARDKEL